MGHLLKNSSNSKNLNALPANGAVPKGVPSASSWDTHRDSFEGLIRSRDAAKLLCMSDWQIRNLAHEGALAYIQRTPRSPMLFDRADLRAWIEKEKIRK